MTTQMPQLYCHAVWDIVLNRLWCLALTVKNDDLCLSRLSGRSVVRPAGSEDVSTHRESQRPQGFQETSEDQN